MTTGELRKLLLKLDPSEKLEVLETRCSDYKEMDAEYWGVVRAVKKTSAGYIMQAHETMSAEEKAAERNFVHFAGN